MLDPYYRTIKGFQILIEKDWISFGHRFQDRLGHISRGTSKEEAPIFLQFIDCVYQMILQFPIYFQFNSKFLIYIVEQMYTCNYGTFIMNSEEEVILNNIKSRTVSLWTHMNLPQVITTFLNPLYDPETSNNNINVEYSMDKLVLWNELYGRSFPGVSSIDTIFCDILLSKFTSYEDKLKNLKEENKEHLKKYQDLIESQKHEEINDESLSVEIEVDDKLKKLKTQGAKQETKDSKLKTNTQESKPSNIHEKESDDSLDPNNKNGDSDSLDGL